MGGPASPRRHGRERKLTVEECRVLPVVAFTRRGIFQGGKHRRGTLRWIDPRSGETQSSLTFEVEGKGREERRLWLFYTIPEAEEPIGLRIGLGTTSCHFGGVRWWFRCPSAGVEEGCEGTRCSKLYLPPHGRHFLCRECHDLTYRSCQRTNANSRAAKLRKEVRDRTSREPQIAIAPLDE